MPSPFYTTGPYGLIRALLGTSNVSDIDAGFYAMATDTETNLVGEVTNRTNAITTEATARANADTVLSGEIITEATNRASADTTLTAAVAALHRGAPARANRSTGGSVGAGLSDIFTDAIITDPDGRFSSGQYIAPKSGAYLVSTQVAVRPQGAGCPVYCGIGVGGANRSIGAAAVNASTNDILYLTCCDLIVVSAGDAITCQVGNFSSSILLTLDVNTSTNYLAVVPQC